MITAPTRRLLQLHNTQPNSIKLLSYGYQRGEYATVRFNERDYKVTEVDGKYLVKRIGYGNILDFLFRSKNKGSNTQILETTLNLQKNTLVDYDAYLEDVRANPRPGCLKGVSLDASKFLWLLRKGVRDFQGINLAGVNLQGCKFNGELLKQIDLSGANLSGANLGSSVITNTNLGGANLSGANLRDVKMNNVVLKEANLCGAKLEGADLTDIDLSKADLTEARLSRGNPLKFSNLQGTKISWEKKSYLESRGWFGGIEWVAGPKEIAWIKNDIKTKQWKTWLNPSGHEVPPAIDALPKGYGVLKMELMAEVVRQSHEAIDSFNENQKIALADVLFRNPAYLRTASPAFVGKLLDAMPKQIEQNGLWKINPRALCGLMNYIESKLSSHDGFEFGRKYSGLICELYFAAKKLSLPEADRFYAAYHQALPEHMKSVWMNAKELDCEAYFALQSDDGNGLLLMSGEYSDDWLGCGKSGRLDFNNVNLFLKNNNRFMVQQESEKINLDSLKIFPRLHASISRALMDKYWAQYEKCLNLGDDLKPVFDNARKKIYKKLIIDGENTFLIQKNIADKFMPFIDKGDKNSERREWTITGKHFNEIINAFGLNARSQSIQAYTLLCLSSRMCYLSSLNAFASDKESIEGLRHYGLALFNKAMQLDQNLILEPQKTSWINQFLSSCTQVLSNAMIRVTRTLGVDLGKRFSSGEYERMYKEILP
jgi:hypothetical protein